MVIEVGGFEGVELMLIVFLQGVGNVYDSREYCKGCCVYL